VPRGWVVGYISAKQFSTFIGQPRSEDEFQRPPIAGHLFIVVYEERMWFLRVRPFFGGIIRFLDIGSFLALAGRSRKGCNHVPRR